ncbi:STAS/SEC14 domain-containing protein [Methyloprofundus sp.]|uniref:STAS/SEC14 domain-containing protein n=1 Tax=Methyloprofundus sp. TaxID=2020875 RepID=UPI003D1291DF
MLEILDIGVDKAVAYHLSGKISEEDMQLAFSVLKEKIEQYGEVYIYQEIDDFTGIEFDAVIEKIKYLFKNGISNISRIAVVTDKPWLRKIVGFEDKLFKSIDMQCFAQQDKALAVEFLTSA